MRRKWFDYFSIFVILLVIASFAVGFGHWLTQSVTTSLFLATFALFIIRTILRMYFYMKDRKQ